MSVGWIARRLLGPAAFRVVGGWYRSIFVDLKKVAQCAAEIMPRNAHILDIGGGDGELINHLLSLRPDVRVTMIDIGESVGSFVVHEVRDRVTCLPKTSLSSYSSIAPESIQATLICDVVHHLGIGGRSAFFSELKAFLNQRTVPVVVIKDIEPGTFIGWLAEVTDKYITGDRGVAQIKGQDLRDFLTTYFPDYQVGETSLMQADPPNYCLTLRRRSNRNEVNAVEL
jgi:hypothetical protein